MGLFSRDIKFPLENPKDSPSSDPKGEKADDDWTRPGKMRAAEVNGNKHHSS